MKKLYVIAPIVATVAFGAYMWNFNQEYNAKVEAKAAQARTDKEAKLKAEVEARKKAIEDALVAQEKRKAERAAKEAGEAAKKEARFAAVDERDKAFREQEKLHRTVERLKKEIATEEEAIAKLALSLQTTEAERTFLQEYVAKAKKNAADLEQVLAQIDAAEAARAAAPKTSS